MPEVVYEVFGFLGFLLRGLGFLVIGFALGRFTLEAYEKAGWQLQIALALGFFGLLIGLTHFSSPGAAGAFALGGGVALLMANTPKKDDDEAKK
jgi:hypothetical protein